MVGSTITFGFADDDWKAEKGADGIKSGGAVI